MANCIRCGRKLAGFSFRKICPWCVQHEAAQRGELPEDARQPVIAAPWVRQRQESAFSLTHVLFGANVAVFLAMLFASGNPLAFINPQTDFSPGLIVHWGANYGPFTLSGQWWRLFTYMFLHGSVLHIAFNMWCLWDLGALAESLYGRWTYAAIYVLTGLAAGLASVAWNPAILTVGASGAIFGLAGALISSFYLGEFSVPRAAMQGTLKSLLFFAGFNLLFGSMFPGIDNSAHVGGLISGVILGALVAKLAPSADAPLRRVAVLAFMALAVTGMAFGISRWRGAPIRMEREFNRSNENQPDRSIAQLQAILRQQPDLVPAHFALGQAYFNQQRFSQAEGEFKRVIELQPANAEARLDLGLTYLSEKRAEDAQKAFADLEAQDPENAEAHYGMGLAFADQEKYQQAIDEFKQAIRAGAQVPDLYYDLGQSYLKAKMYDDAIAAYHEQQKQKGSDDADTENGLAEAYQAKGMKQESEQARNRAAQLKNGTQ